MRHEKRGEENQCSLVRLGRGARMRALLVFGAIETGISVSNKPESRTMSSLMAIWNEWEIQLVVLFSFMLQIFLFFTGNLRRRKVNGPLRGSIWLAYVGADAVAVYALGLFSRYEEKFQLIGTQSSGDTLPFLWVSFLLVHLGGQDSITAFSIEDYNLWLRHFLNLVLQGILALYVFWKSFQRINSQIPIPSMFIFASGIIKYGERTWALRSASRDSLGKSSGLPPGQNSGNNIHSIRSRASYALQTVLLVRGLFVGRTVFQLGDSNGTMKQKLESEFHRHGQGEGKLEIIAMELSMMFDLLYTKAMVLQNRKGRIFRLAAQISIVVSFVIFLTIEKQAHNFVNVAISYTLFVGAILMEACSVATVIASPWTRAHMKEGAIHHLLSSSNSVCSHFKGILYNEMQWLSPNYSIGQINHREISRAFTSRVISHVIYSFGLERQWRNRFVRSVEAQGIVRYILQWFERSPEELFGRVQLGRRANYTLSLPFEHAIYRLHVFTDLHISRHFDDASISHAADVVLLKEECEKLSNYMYYLQKLHASMLPVSAAEEYAIGCPPYNKRDKTDTRTKLQLLEDAAAVLVNEPDSVCPFERAPEEPDLRRSLEEIREMWMRLLVYAAGKCGGELHARQLGDGGELLTFVWLLMLHHGLGDAATEVKLLTSDDPTLPQLGSVVSFGGNWGPMPEQPRYAFDFTRRQQYSPQPEAESVRRQLARMTQQLVAGPESAGLVVVVANSELMQQIVPGHEASGSVLIANETELIGDLMPQLLSGAALRDGTVTMSEGEAGSSGHAEEDDASTSGENGTVEQTVVAALEVEHRDMVEDGAN